VGLSRTVSAFVEAAGKEAAARRGRLRQVVGFAAEYYRRLLHIQSGAALSEEDELSGLVQQAASDVPDDAAATAARLDRCLEAAEQIGRNANQTTLIEAWLDDLAGM
jgi:primosomal protein N''